MGHYPITVTGRWVDYNTRGMLQYNPIGYSSGLRITTNYNHQVTWLDDYNYTYTLYTDENVIITNTHPVYKTRVLTKPATSGGGGTLSLVDWALTAVSGIYVTVFDAKVGGAFDCTRSLLDTNNYLVHHNDNNTKFIAVNPGTHTVKIEKTHYINQTRDVTCLVDQYPISTFFMQFKGGRLSGRVMINPSRLEDFTGGYKNGVKVELLNQSGKSVLQVVTPNGVLDGSYTFYPVKTGIYTIKGSIIVTSEEALDPNDVGTYQGLYNGGATVEVTTASTTSNLDFTISKV